MLFVEYFPGIHEKKDNHRRLGIPITTLIISHKKIKGKKDCLLIFVKWRKRRKSERGEVNEETRNDHGQEKEQE